MERCNCQNSFSALEPCTIPSSGEVGECINLLECPALIEEFKRDRSNAPVVCNKESRKICCPSKYLTSSSTKATFADNVLSRGSFSDDDSDDSENSNTSQINKSQ